MLPQQRAYYVACHGMRAAGCWLLCDYEVVRLF
jgi:hypothetical protein